MSMPDTRTINSAQKVNDEQGEYTCIKAVINSVEMFIPKDDFNNVDRKLIKAWEDAGNTIAEAD
jgi:hypothetical protein|tara:strand:- start:338 stop:529 length:192 start_codon:yes stop_codon:yes gene_type:complete